MLNRRRSGTAVQLSAVPNHLLPKRTAARIYRHPHAGSFRIVDNACDYNGNVIDATAGQTMRHDSPTVRQASDAVGNTVVWQGFMQSQTFSGQLGGNPQEREFPVICPLGVLSGVDIVSMPV